MTSDFRAFAIAPKGILPAGSILTSTQVQSLASKLGNVKTPYIYACFGDVAIADGEITYGVTAGPMTTSATGTVLASGCILPLQKGQGIDLSTSTNPAMILFFAT